MVELEARQDKLLLKLDNLYEKIKNISSLCKLSDAKIEPKIQKTKINKKEYVSTYWLDLPILI